MKTNRNHLFLLLAGLFFLSGYSAQAQSEDQKFAFGVHLGWSKSNDDFKNHYFVKGNLEKVATVSAHYFLHPKVNLGLRLSHGDVSTYNTIVRRSVTTTLNSAQIAAEYFPLKESWRFRPYIYAGLAFVMSDNWLVRENFSSTKKSFGTHNAFVAFPIGLGAQYKINDMLKADVNFRQVSSPGKGRNADLLDGYIPPVGNEYNDQYYELTGGVIAVFAKPKDSDEDGVNDKKDKCPETPKAAKVDANGCPIDTDGDGIADYLDDCPNDKGPQATKGCPDKDGDLVPDKDDKCPDAAGLASLGGCPDKDGDGIIDKDDSCPTVKGLEAFKGCPDTDGDGIQDSEDACPELKGIAQYKGCPDTDGDGITDNVDKCPTIPGIPAEQGCPEVKKEVTQLFQKALQGIQFQTGKSVIKPASFPILNSIVKVMNDNPTYKLNIGGHTDDVGDDASNMTLSQNRADAVSQYLIKKGINPMRLSAKGYGETQPVDTNKTAAGRKQNRRVELKVEFIQVVK